MSRARGSSGLAGVAERLTAFCLAWIPDPFVIAILLTLVVAALAMALTGSSFLEVVDHWGQGLPALHSFAMQMCLIMLGGYIVAVSPPVEAALRKLARWPRSSRQAVALTALLSMGLALLNWGISLVAAAFFTRALARERRRLPYALVIASAYLGMSATWHAGLSASAPLMVATPGNFLEKDLGGVIPISATILHPFSIGLVLVTIVVLVALATALYSERQEIDVRLPEAAADERAAADPAVPALDEAPPRSFAAWTERSRVLSWVFVLLAVVRLGWQFQSRGPNLDLDAVNLMLLAAGVLLHGTPRRFLRAAREGAGQLWGIVIQFPLYAGIYGIIRYSNLQDVLAGYFTQVATRETFPLYAYWYSGILNYFIPSGGSKWAIEAPYMVQAAAKLGVPQSLTVLAYAWGDMMTDAIQPFWAIPLLGIARLGFRDIMGYLLVFFVAIAGLASIGFWLAPRWF